MISSLSVPQPKYVPNPARSWMKRDRESSRFYVYVLKLDSGKFYVGQTRRLLERITEHKEGRAASTAGANPKMRYFEVLPTREEAMRREHVLKRLARYDVRELCKIIRTFHDFISEIEID
jgi:putative endonuclease